MTCGPKNKEDQFLKALQSSTTYEIKDNRLYLSNPDGVKVIFKKID
jgi:heat shock protein HslJ